MLQSRGRKRDAGPFRRHHVANLTAQTFLGEEDRGDYKKEVTPTVEGTLYSLDNLFRLEHYSTVGALHPLDSEI